MKHFSANNQAIKAARSGSKRYWQAVSRRMRQCGFHNAARDVLTFI